MKKQSSLYQMTYAMFILSLAIMACFVLVTLFGRAMGGTDNAPTASYGPRSVARAMVSEALGSIEHGKQLDHGLVATISDKYNLVSITQTEKDLTPTGFFCGTNRSIGYTVLDGILYDGVAYSLYHSYDEVTGNTSLDYTANSISLSTGEANTDLHEQDLPTILLAITDDQLFGGDVLPTGITRLNADWYNNLNAPNTSVVISEDCMGVVMGNIGAVTLFGLLFGIAWVIEKKRNI